MMHILESLECMDLEIGCTGRCWYMTVVDDEEVMS